MHFATDLRLIAARFAGVARLTSVRTPFTPFLCVKSRRRLVGSLVAYSALRMAHKSGNRFLPIVVCRYAAPLDPPVPGLVPMVRSTIRT